MAFELRRYRSAAGGEPFLIFMRKHVFEPLGMQDTIADSLTDPIPNQTTSYFPRFAWVNSRAFGSGSGSTNLTRRFAAWNPMIADCGETIYAKCDAPYSTDVRHFRNLRMASMPWSKL